MRYESYRNQLSVIARMFPSKPTATTVTTKYQNNLDMDLLTGWNMVVEVMSMPISMPDNELELPP